MRSYSIYYAPKKVTALVSSTDPVSTARGSIFFGIRGQNLLLRNGDFYKKCGFYVLPEVTVFLTTTWFYIVKLRISLKTSFLLPGASVTILFNILPLVVGKHYS